MILFNPELHEYTDSVTGAVIRSVTQILLDAGLIDNRWYTAEARDRGTAVHTLCERFAQGVRLDDAGRALDSLEYVISFAEWMRDTGAYAVCTESLVMGAINGRRYAGKFDGLFEIKGKRYLVDIKTGAKSKWHKMQLAAYSLARFDDGRPVNPDGAIALYLKKNARAYPDKLGASELIDGIHGFKESIAKS